MRGHQWGAQLSPTARGDPGVCEDVGATLCRTLGGVVGTQDTSYCHEASAEPGRGAWGAR